jgi:hypothetical protein
LRLGTTMPSAEYVGQLLAQPARLGDAVGRHAGEVGQHRLDDVVRGVGEQHLADAGAGHPLVHRRMRYVPTVLARFLGLKGPALGQHVGHRGPDGGGAAAMVAAGAGETTARQSGLDAGSGGVQAN